MADHCPKCQSHERVKAGFNNGKQRYKCKHCRCHYTRSTPKGYPPEKRELALKMYLEGLGFRSIGRILNLHNVTVFNWIREVGYSLPEDLVTGDEKPSVHYFELDELWHYVGKKLKNVGCGLLLTGYESACLPPHSAVVVWRQGRSLFTS